MFVGVVVAAVVPESWWALSLLPAVVLGGYGAVRGAVARRAEVTTAAFTRTRVQLRNALGERVVEVADLTGVDVEHTGSTKDGYRRTMLGLAFADGRVERIPGRYDPELAGTLREVLGPAVDVRERHHELVPPPNG
jgi:hypothetical protein